MRPAQSTAAPAPALSNIPARTRSRGVLTRIDRWRAVSLPYCCGRAATRLLKLSQLHASLRFVAVAGRACTHSVWAGGRTGGSVGMMPTIVNHRQSHQSVLGIDSTIKMLSAQTHTLLDAVVYPHRLSIPIMCITLSHESARVCNMHLTILLCRWEQLFSRGKELMGGGQRSGCNVFTVRKMLSPNFFDNNSNNNNGSTVIACLVRSHGSHNTYELSHCVCVLPSRRQEQNRVSCCSMRVHRMLKVGNLLINNIAPRSERVSGFFASSKCVAHFIWGCTLSVFAPT